jgi:hypothetical protein
MKNQNAVLLAGVVLAILAAGSFVPAQTVVSWSYNKDGFYNTACYLLPKDADWTRKFSVTADYNSFSACFYKVYYCFGGSTSSTVNTIIQSPSGRHSVIGYVMFYWKDGSSEQQAVANQWKKVIDPNLECAEFNGCCSSPNMMDPNTRCGASWVMEGQYDWRQNALQCITLGNLPDSTKYYFKIYFWTCPPVLLSTMTNGYFSPSNFPPKYDTLRKKQAIPYIQWNLWLMQGCFITGKKPPAPTVGGPRRYR